ncbi:MAG: hypothetical protein ACYCUI_12415 [Vulcanimicrobiaceae bacterium]|jgi:hypothetical protein|nr:hypothetical protein [Pseudomonadota bacterium]
MYDPLQEQLDRKLGLKRKPAEDRYPKTKIPGFWQGFSLPLIAFLYQVLVHGDPGRGIAMALIVYVLTFGGYIFES